MCVFFFFFLLFYYLAGGRSVLLSTQSRTYNLFFFSVSSPVSFSRAVSLSLWPVTLMKIEEYYVGRCCTTLDIFFFFHIQERCSLPRSLHKRRRSTLKPFFECKKLSKKKMTINNLTFFFFNFQKTTVCVNTLECVCVCCF